MECRLSPDYDLVVKLVNQAMLEVKVKSSTEKSQPAETIIGVIKRMLPDSAKLQPHPVIWLLIQILTVVLSFSITNGLGKREET